ncbi:MULTISPECIES: hypothetical protein [Terrabacteria group]|uniref:Uncharacterized protein n=1 Tax=Pseudonocardia charpentierae TaxID=3075545 RepID=A0ABU2NJE6_9PSEU|nr:MULTISPECIES: hypothetical protein [Terrabacteria group]MDT0354096.1 hypothetical protein [Pseudonocardia sp. DSM 45834]SDY88507.1 hypothetical protein SAMN05444416_109168 [Thermoactinomyces sp. DSM 45892]
MTKKVVVKPGDSLSIKVSTKLTKEQLQLISDWKQSKILSTKFFEKVDEELHLAVNHEIQLPIPRPLTIEEQEKLSQPIVQQMLGNLCMALISNEIPDAIVGTSPPSQVNLEQPVGVDTTVVSNEADACIDAALDDW